MVGRVSLTILGAIVGSLAAVAAIILFFGWGLPHTGQATYIDPTRADYIDLLLTLTTVFLGAIGLAVTVGALVIGLVALKTLREIKDEAAESAKSAAATQISLTMETKLAPSVKSNLEDALPTALRSALLDDQTGHKIFTDMAQAGTLDEVMERVVVRIQGGGREIDSE